MRIAKMTTTRVTARTIPNAVLLFMLDETIGSTWQISSSNEPFDRSSSKSVTREVELETLMNPRTES
jgi:hypothetical protein